MNYPENRRILFRLLFRHRGVHGENGIKLPLSGNIGCYLQESWWSIGRSKVRSRKSDQNSGSIPRNVGRNGNDKCACRSHRADCDRNTGLTKQDWRNAGRSLISGNLKLFWFLTGVGKVKVMITTSDFSGSRELSPDSCALYRDHCGKVHRQLVP